MWGTMPPLVYPRAKHPRTAFSTSEDLSALSAQIEEIVASQAHTMTAKADGGTDSLILQIGGGPSAEPYTVQSVG
jgi:hypothetical protein